MRRPEHVGVAPGVGVVGRVVEGLGRQAAYVDAERRPRVRPAARGPSPTLASSDRYGANSGPCTEESSSAAKRRLGAQPRGERAAPGREGRGAAGPGRHHAVPLQDRVADRLPRRPGRQVPDHRAQRERGDRERVAEDALEVLRRSGRRGRGAARGSGPRGAAARTRCPAGRSRCRGARWRSPPGRRAARRGAAARPTPTTCRRRARGRCRAGSRSARTGTRPALRNRTAPLRSAMTTLLTGATHASRARSTSSTVRARSSGSSASKPRSPRTVGASRTASPRPRSRSISNSGPRSVASTSTVTGSAPRTAMVSSRPSTTSSRDSSKMSW